MAAIDLSSLPDGPGLLRSSLTVLRHLQDPYAAYERLRREYGDLFTIRSPLFGPTVVTLTSSGARDIIAAGPEDFDTEFLSLTAAIRVVDSLDEALEHIHVHGTGHSDAIVTEDYEAAMRFLDEVDSAVCYVNASTQFTDGAQFGLGAEIIDSTQKTIARGPVGLREITTYKWIVLGTGQIRPK